MLHYKLVLKCVYAIQAMFGMVICVFNVIVYVQECVDTTVVIVV